MASVTCHNSRVVTADERKHIHALTETLIEGRSCESLVEWACEAFAVWAAVTQSATFEAAMKGTMGPTEFVDGLNKYQNAYENDKKQKSWRLEKHHLQMIYCMVVRGVFREKGAPMTFAEFVAVFIWLGPHSLPVTKLAGPPLLWLNTRLPNTSREKATILSHGGRQTGLAGAACRRSERSPATCRRQLVRPGRVLFPDHPLLPKRVLDNDRIYGGRRVLLFKNQLQQVTCSRSRVRL
ncbi:MAG: hypothetical protein KGL39_21060 [Patescibacteria group bacterium]|nr:hypothetical protein [Patescibacteria group bacterium]